MKRVLTIQDISCIGRCSLTVALPVLSVMGLETAVLPTALLSTHTAFEGVYKKDMTESIDPTFHHWNSQKISFDSIACGYLGSVEQMDIVRQYFSLWKGKALLLIDPVMGDQGKLYAGFDENYRRNMRIFCQSADVLLPNLTEMAYLLDVDYRSLPKDREGYEQLARELSRINNGIVVIKGISLTRTMIAVLAYHARTGEIVFCEREKLAVEPFGTGDIFAAVCQGALTKGMELKRAVELAMDFVLECIKRTMDDPKRRWYGVNFEEALPFLIASENDSAYYI